MHNVIAFEYQSAILAAHPLPTRHTHTHTHIKAWADSFGSHWLQVLILVWQTLVHSLIRRMKINESPNTCLTALQCCKRFSCSLQLHIFTLQALYRPQRESGKLHKKKGKLKNAILFIESFNQRQMGNAVFSAGWNAATQNRTVSSQLYIRMNK